MLIPLYMLITTKLKTVLFRILEKKHMNAANGFPKHKQIPQNRHCPDRTAIIDLQPSVHLGLSLPVISLYTVLPLGGPSRDLTST